MLDTDKFGNKFVYLQREVNSWQLKQHVMKC